MNYTLMNKNTPILTCEMDDIFSIFTKIVEFHNPEYLPIGVGSPSSEYFKKKLNVWFMSRSIPASRDGLTDALMAMDISNSNELLTKSLGLSLSDQYWINPGGELSWDEINFFTNPFSEDVGDILLGKFSESSEGIDFKSPDNTSDGVLKKRWKIINGERVLVKGGTDVYKQQPINEVLVSILLKRLDIHHVQYKLLIEDEEPYSLCKNFITPDTELVSAWQIYNSFDKKSNNDSHYTHFMKAVESLGIEGMTEYLNSLLSIDYIVANTDRHYGNFGVIRDVNTLQFVGTAPIYDTGTSLWHDVETTRIRASRDVKSRPFRDWHSRQIEYVTSFDRVDLGKLSGFEEQAHKVLEQFEHIGSERRDVLARGVQKRINNLQKIIDDL